MTIDTTNLSYGFIDAQPVNIDWRAAQGEDGEGVTIHMPEPTLETLKQYDAEPKASEEDEDYDAEDALEEAIEAFKESDSYYEWSDAHFPMMNYLWPCEPAYGVSDQNAADAIEERGGSTVLVTVERDGEDIQGIALTGGGMDLSWDLCAAYICCGNVPPIRLLSGLPHYAGMRNSEMATAILECMSLAALYLEDRAERLRRDRDRLAEHLSE